MAPQIVYVGWLMLLLIAPGQGVSSDNEGEGINGVLTGEFPEFSMMSSESTAWICWIYENR